MKSFPISRKLVREFLPATYKGRRVTMEPTTTVTFWSLNWDGGTKSEYVFFRLLDGARVDLSVLGTIHPARNAAEGHVVQLAPGYLCVEHWRYAGQTEGVRIHVHPKDLPRYLPAPLTTETK